MCHRAKLNQSRSKYNFIKIGKGLQRYGDLTVFKMAAVHHLGFVKFKFLMVGALRDPFCICVPNFVKIGQTVAKISRFVWFSRWRPPPFRFSKIRHFNCRSTVRGEFASPCQISSKSVKRLQRYGNLTVFKMAADRHLGFVKFKSL